MSWIRVLAILTAIAAVVSGAISIFAVTRNPPPAKPDPLQGPDESVEPLPSVPMEFVDPYPDVNLSAEALDDFRRAELSRRARRPDGDPLRRYGRNYESVLRGPKPKPAVATPPTTCRSVEPVPDDSNHRSGPHGVHDSTVHDFESQSGFGYWRMLTFKNGRGLSVASEDVDRVELVSLLTDLQPSVYVLDEMATPPLARRAERRPLDEFERLGLEAVRKGDELVWTREAPKRMFGAIRARADCLHCHSKAKEGDLLGAFTYYLEVPVDQLDRRK